MDNDSGRRIYDVGRPAQPQPPPTSKPIIVGHRPVMPDPMLRRDYRYLHPPAARPPVAAAPAAEPPTVPPDPPPEFKMPPQPPEVARPGPPFAKYAPRQATPPPRPDLVPPRPLGQLTAEPAARPEDLTVQIPAGKVSVWRSPLTWLGSGLLVIAIAIVVWLALRIVGH